MGILRERPSLLREQILKAAALSHPAGMKVRDFTIVFDHVFTDGLGNDSKSKLLQCTMAPGVREKINWGDKDVGLYNLDFDKVFLTEVVDHAYRDKWRGD